MQELYAQYKGLLFKLAYQLTGSTSDAEDAVHDVFLKLYDVNPERLVKPKAYLCKMVTNRCLDLLKSARRKREQYFGHWLPEPVLTPNDKTLESVVRGELLSYAVLVMLEKLSPTERAAFVLREALDCGYSFIAEVVGKSEPHCRKLVSRAREKMGITHNDPVSAEAASEEWVHRFLLALQQGHVDTVMSLLAEDIILISDGGGKVPAASHPIESCERVVQFLFGLIRQAPHFEGGVHIEIEDINGQNGCVLRSSKGIVAVALTQVENNLIHKLYFIRNPDKLSLPRLW